MSIARQRRSPDEVARLAAEVYGRQIRPKVEPEFNDKFIAIDVETGEYELDDYDRTAVKKLRARVPSADVYLGRVGHRAAHRLRAAK